MEDYANSRVTALGASTSAPSCRNSAVAVLSACNTTEGNTMKLSRTATLTSCAIGACLVAGSFILTPRASGAPLQCSLDKLQGRYVFAGQGANLHYGIFNFDGAGKFQGKQTSAREQTNAQRENLTGTYTLGADCAGTLILEGEVGGTAHWDIFVTEDGKKGRMIRTDPGVFGVRSFEQ
jgi:hypothetical protein